MPATSPRPSVREIYHNAVAADEERRLRSEAYMFAWSARFDVPKLERYLRHGEELFATRNMTPREKVELEVMRRAVEVARNITDEELVAAGFQARQRAEAA